MQPSFFSLLSSWLSLSLIFTLCSSNEEKVPVIPEIFSYNLTECSCCLFAVFRYPTEFLHSLTPSGMPPHRLRLKVNTIVMLLRNISLRDGLCNGTRLIVRGLHSNVVEAEILLGRFEGMPVLQYPMSIASVYSMGYGACCEMHCSLYYFYYM